MKIYFDNCILNRPFDDQTQERIYLETQAFLVILRKIESGKIEMVNSFAIEYEVNRVSDWERQNRIMDYLKIAREYVDFNSEIETRGNQLTKLGFKAMDALHLAAAEIANVEYFISCDDEFLNISRRNKKKIKTKVLSIFEMVEAIYHVESSG